MNTLLALALVAFSAPPTPEIAEGAQLTAEAQLRLLSERWLAAVAARDTTQAIELADQIAGSTEDVVVAAEAIELASAAGLNTTFFAMPFNELDYDLWAHAYFFKALGRRVIGERTDTARALFEAAAAGMAPATEEADTLCWPREAFRRGRGTGVQRAWVLCELAYQQGFEVQLVELRDATGERVPHALCELRLDSDIVFLADPEHGVFIPRETYETLLEDQLRAAQAYHQHDFMRRVLARGRLMTPALPQDYCPRNQRLGAALRHALGDRCPRFGEDPLRRVVTYRALRDARYPAPLRYSMGLWPYPFSLLVIDVAQRVRTNAP